MEYSLYFPLHLGGQQSYSWCGDGLVDSLVSVTLKSRAANMHLDYRTPTAPSNGDGSRLLAWSSPRGRAAE